MKNRKPLAIPAFLRISGGLLLLALGMLSRETPAAPPTSDQIQWQPWSNTIFDRAKAEQKLVLLDLGAVWCHWCHVWMRSPTAIPR